jgi:chemotaxis protein MotD
MTAEALASRLAPPSGQAEGRTAPSAPHATAWQDRPGRIEAAPVMAAGRTTPEVTRRETHFAPVLRQDTAPSRTPAPGMREPGAPAKQPPAAPASGADPATPPRSDTQATPRTDTQAIMAQIVQAIASGASQKPGPREPQPSSQTHQPAPVQATQSQAGPVRMVEIQLHPASLGSLTVTMRLSPAGLKVSVTASVRETAHRLETDKAELTDLIRRAGYDAAEVSIDMASAPDADAGRGSASQQENGPAARRDHASRGTPRHASEEELPEPAPSSGRTLRL